MGRGRGWGMGGIERHVEGEEMGRGRGWAKEEIEEEEGMGKRRDRGGEWGHGEGRDWLRGREEIGEEEG